MEKILINMIHFPKSYKPFLQENVILKSINALLGKARKLVNKQNSVFSTYFETTTYIKKNEQGIRVKYNTDIANLWPLRKAVPCSQVNITFTFSFSSLGCFQSPYVVRKTEQCEKVKCNSCYLLVIPTSKKIITYMFSLGYWSSRECF